MFREDKATAMTAFFLSKTQDRKLNDIKLMKLLYIAERTSLERYATPISYDQFCSMEHGPVLSGTYELLTDKEKTPTWDKHISPLSLYVFGGDQSVSLLEDISWDEILRQCDVEILDYVWDTFGHMSKWQIKKYCHDNFPEYDERPEAMKTSIGLDLETIFVALGDNQELAAEKAEDVKFYA